MCNLENMYSYTGLIFETVLYIYLSLSWFQCFAWDSLQVSTGHIPIDIASMIHTSLRKQDPFCHCRSVPSLVASFSTRKDNCTCSDPSRYSPFHLSTAEDHWSTLPSAGGPGVPVYQIPSPLEEVHRLWLHPEDTKVPSVLELSIFRSVASAWSQVWAHGSVGMPRPTGWEENWFHGMS